MRSFIILTILCLCSLLVPVSCVDQLDLSLTQHVNVVVVDGTITNLAEPQIIRLNRAKSDSLTGRFGTLPLTKAQVEVVVDSAQVIPCHETTDGNYQLPSDFRGQVGHAYQLRFTLSDGSRYQSTQQVMLDVPSISKVSAHFNPTSISPPLLDIYKAGHDLYIDTQDPANQHNYYKWDWNLYERQDWCRSCPLALYLVWNYSDTQLLEACDTPDQMIPSSDYFINDYPCRTDCWEIIHSNSINVFDDRYSNGGLIANRKVAQIPFYDHNGVLVEIRQLSLTIQAYSYFKQFQDQTQNTGGLADTPPTALAGNVRNISNAHERVVGYFTASAVSTIRYWLDRKDTQGVPPGLFQALNGRDPSGEGDYFNNRPKPVIFITPSKYYSRPPTALCVPSDSRTPYKPAGWQD